MPHLWCISSNLFIVIFVYKYTIMICFDYLPMDIESIHISPFDASLGLNILMYIFLALSNTLLSSTYLINLSKRYPIKSGDYSEVKTGFIQAIVASIPFFFQNTTYFFTQDLPVLSISCKSILFISGISFCFLSTKTPKSITLENSVSKYLASMALISTISFISMYFGSILSTILLALSVLILLVLLKKAFSTSIQPSNEPHTADISRNSVVNALKLILFPLEVILENIMIIPDSRKKSYSIKTSSKVLFSPFCIAVLSMYYFKKAHEILWLVSSIIASLAIGTAMLFLYKRLHIASIFTIYSILMSCIIQYFIFDQLIMVANNISRIMSYRIHHTLFVLIIPLLSTSSICIQTGFIRAGFQKRSLISIYFFAIVNTITSIIINSMAQRNTFIRESKVKYTFGGIFVLLILTLFDIFRLGGRYTRNNWILPAYNIIQECIIEFSSLR